MNTQKSTLNQILSQAASKFAHLVAVKGSGFSFTYQQFDQITDAFAQHLTKAGIKPGILIGICLPRSAEMLIGIFGALKAGCAYVPADPDYPAERIKFVFEDAGITCVITTEPLVCKLTDLGFSVFVPSLAPDAIEEFVFESRTQPNNLAYVLFTSGSTGKPKGVMVEHHSVVNLIRSVQYDYPLSQGDVVLLKSPYTFDGSVWELYGWMEQGSTLYVAPPGYEKDPAALAQVIYNEKISFAFFVSSMLSSFLDYIDATGNRAMLSSLKWVSAGGEVVSPVLVQRFYKLLQAYGAHLINVYGPTETTVYATTFLCEPDINYTKIPVGKAVANDFIYIIGDDGQLMPQGEEGEICIGGAGVARGYLNRQELSSERFVPDPQRPGEHMYRTGDIGKMLPNNLLDFIGRRDFQVKLRGLRIELGEIENALYNLGQFKEVAVLFTKDRSGDDSLIGCFVPNDDDLQPYLDDYQLLDSTKKDKISKDLEQSLPAFMLPSEYIVCKRFPVNENGKLDRQALPTVASLYASTSEAFIPGSETESCVYTIWQKILSRESIHGDEDFFEAGGHSLKAIQVITALIEAFGVELPLHVFYSGMTISKMVKTIDEYKHTTQSQHITTSIASNNLVYAVSDTQAEMLLLNEMDQTKLQHNILVEFDLKGTVEIELLKRNLALIVQEEEIFRSTFALHDDAFKQIIHSKAELLFDFVDASLDGNSNMHYQELMQLFGQTVFNPGQLPLFAFKLIKLQPTHYKLLLVIHHIIFDGWSLQLFTRKLSDIYAFGKTSPALQNPIRIGDFAQWHKQFSGQVAQEQLAYWKTVFPDVPATLTIPKKFKTDRSKAGINGKRHWFWIPENDSLALEQLCQSLKITPFSFFLGVYKLALAAWSGQNDCCIGTPFANRKHPDVANLIGYFTNMVAIRSYIDVNQSFNEYLKQLSQVSVQAFSHADISFGQVVKALGIPPQQGVHPLFQAMFIMQNWPNVQTEFPGFTLEQKELGNNTCKADFSFNVEKTGNIYECWLEYDTELYALQQVELITADIKMLIEWITTKPENSLADIPTFLASRSQQRHSGNCILIGDGTINLHCIDILQSYNFSVTHLVSSDTSLAKPCKEKGVAFTQDLDLFSSVPFDFLFSINNGLLLGNDIVTRASKLAVNYHDSPLPRYAGMFAPNHALANVESLHGVSWHKIVDRIDGGAILESEPVPVFEEDTAWLLNTRCFEAALKSFDRLALRLAKNDLTAREQDLNLRTFYPRLRRPEGLGLIRWQCGVQELSALVRSTDFGGHYINEFMLPHIKIDKAFYTFEKASFTQDTRMKPGELACNEGLWSIACKDGSMHIAEVYDSANNRISFTQLVEIQSLSAGNTLELIPDEEVKHVGELFKTYCKNETWWKDQLAITEYLSWPFEHSNQGEATHLSIHFDVKLQMGISRLNDEPSNVVLAATLLYLLQLSDTLNGSFGFISSDLSGKLGGFTSLFSPILPLTVAVEESITMQEAIHLVISSILLNKTKGTYTCDLPLRYPNLRDSATNHPAIVFINNVIELELVPKKAVGILVQENKIELFFPENTRIDYLIAQSIEHSFIYFLQALVKAPQATWNQIQLMDAAFFESTYGQLNQHPEASVEDVIALFRRVSEMYADEIAIETADKGVAYREFYSDVQKMAKVLLQSGLQKNDVVAVSLERGYGYYVSIMATLYLGCAFLPIDPSHPAARKNYMLSDSKSVILIGDDFGVDGCTLKIIPVQAYENEAIKDVQPLEPNDGLAYIIYTSGSTGMPKGVKISRKALSTFTNAAMQLYKVTNRERILQFANLGFDASIEEIFCAFCSGSTLYPRTDDMLLPQSLVDETRAKMLNFWDLPTAYWRQVVQYLASNSLNLPASLETVIIGGEAAYPEDIVQWEQITHAHCTLYNTYGPTETTVVALAHAMPKTYLPKAAVPIGKPLLGYGAFVTDKYKRVLPLGVAGELVVTGPAVADGYLNSQQKEMEVFVQIPLPTSKSVRAYCTGDRVVLNSQLNVNYLGRRDNQVKIRGFRVELQEIEHAVEALTGSAQCVACCNGPERFQNQLVVFVLGEIVNIDELKSSLSQKLPAYMVPTSFFGIESMPLTANGKTDIKALWNMALAQQQQFNEAFAEPSNEIEVKMLEVWREVLGLENLGVTHDFFESGGHSLKAVSLITKLHKLFQVNLPLASLITHPTVHQLAQLVASGKPVAQWQCLVPIRPEGNKTPLFLVHGAGLNVLLYQSLGKNLQPNRPIYALQAKGLDGKQQISTSIPEMAADYIIEIQQVQPNGPYLLFGFSLGGFIAYEMANQLMAKGEEVRFLGVIDTVTYAAHEDLPVLQYLFRQFKLLLIKPLFILWMFLMEPWEAKGKYLATKYGNLRHEVLYQLMKRGIIRTASLRKEKTSNDEQLPVFQKAQVAIIIYNALKTYTLLPTQVLLDLFRAEKKAFYIPERKTYGWGRFAKKGVKVHNIPGEHSLIFAPPNDKLFAGILDKRLEELESFD